MGIRYRKDTGSWEVSHQSNKRRIRRSVATREEARDLLAKLKADAYNERVNRYMGRKPDRTFGEALERWAVDYLPRLRSAKPTADHAGVVRQHIDETLYLHDVPEAARRMTSSMQANGLKPATINKRLAIIRRVLYLAEEWGWISESLGRKIKLLPTNNERHIYLTTEEIYELANACKEGRDIILQLAFTGLRLSELYSLRPSDVRDSFIVLQPKTKNGKPRSIPISDPIRNCPIPPKITQNQLRYRWDAARVQVGHPDLHLHDLRHSTAYLLVKAGATLAHVKDWLGHSSLSVTTRYLHLTRDDLAEVAAKLG